MTIIGINGKLRQGKGILATKLAVGIADKGGKILSNYSIDSPRSTTIDFYDLIDLLQKPRQKPKVTLVLDEIHAWLDSYIGQSKTARFGSYFVFQSAKLGYDLIYTTQLTMRAINTLRELCNYRYYAINDSQNKRFIYAILDSNVTDNDVPTGNYFQITYQEASKFWDRYDTYEGVNPLGIQLIKRELEKLDIKKMDDEIQRQVCLIDQELKAKSQQVLLTKLQVKSLLISLHEHTTYLDVIYTRLQSQRQYSYKQELEKKLSHMAHQKSVQLGHKELLELWEKQ